MSWFTAGAIILASAFAANSAMFVAHRVFGWGRAHRSVNTAPGPKKLTAVGALIYTGLVCGFLAPFVAVAVAPESGFAGAVGTPGGTASFAMWCMGVTVVIQTALALAGHPSWRSKAL